MDKDWNQTVALPNPRVRDNFLAENEMFIYPNDQHKKAGIRLVAELPQGAEFSAETFRVLAAKQPIPDSLLKERYDRMLEKLDQSNIDWAESSSAFTIKKK